MKQPCFRLYRCQRGAALLIMFMVLLLAATAILLKGLSGKKPGAQQQDATIAQLAEVREALYGFALANGYFPCPAKSFTDGTEDRTGATCTGGKRVGFIPWIDLGVARTDAWGRLIRYSVTPAFSNSLTKFTSSSSRDISIKATTSGVDITDSPFPVVIMSHGKNGYRGTTETGQAVPDPSATNTDEETNASAFGTIFVSKVMTDDTTTTGGEFDDIVTWLPFDNITNKMNKIDCANFPPCP